MLSKVEESNNRMLTALNPVATFIDTKLQSAATRFSRK